MTDTPAPPPNTGIRVRYGTRTEYDPTTGLYLSEITEHVEMPPLPGQAPQGAWLIDDSPSAVEGADR